LPPPPGYFEPQSAADESARLGEILRLLLARELAVLMSGALVCPRPTPTWETGDDVWTSAERARADEVGRRIYPRAGGDAVAEGETEAGAHVFVSFLERLDERAKRATSREEVAHAPFLPTYLRQHPVRTLGR
jgi:hypothetical protein